jgi:hypothetical protein
MPSIPQRDKAGLLGPVRSVRTDVFHFAREGDEVREKPWYHSTVGYNDAGYVTEQVTQNPNGTVSRNTYRYDGEGRLAETRGEVDGVGSGRTVYLYDSLGRLSYELSLEADESEGRQTRRFYDAEGSYTEEFTVEKEEAEKAPAGARASFIRTRRDAADQPLEVRFYAADGGLLYRIVYHYNERGRLTDMEQRTGDAPLFDLPAGANPAGSRLAEFPALFSPDTALSTVRYRYDEQGRRIESATWIGPHCTERRVYEYDERGEKSAERRYGRDGQLASGETFEREYDARGNWVREIVRQGGEPSVGTRRTILYYGSGQ